MHSHTRAGHEEILHILNCSAILDCVTEHQVNHKLNFSWQSKSYVQVISQLVFQAFQYECRNNTAAYIHIKKKKVTL